MTPRFRTTLRWRGGSHHVAHSPGRTRAAALPGSRARTLARAGAGLAVLAACAAGATPAASAAPAHLSEPSVAASDQMHYGKHLRLLAWTPPATEGTPWSGRLVAVGGQAPYSYTTGGIVGPPAWLTIHPDGSLTGTPERARGTVTVRFRVVDVRGAIADRDVTIRVRPGAGIPRPVPGPTAVRVEPPVPDIPPVCKVTDGVTLCW